MTKLGVNIDHIATIRQARQALEPDPVAAAVLAELAGADGITIHLRGDRRHISDVDLRRLRETVTTRLNLEMAPTREMVRIAVQMRPDQVTLVPERPDEVTTEGGLDVRKTLKLITSSTQRLRKAGLDISLFIDPDLKQVNAASNLGVSMIEINTRSFAEACPRSPDLETDAVERELGKVVSAAKTGSDLGLKVLAGHGLTYRNVGLISAIPEVVELNIGHNIVARASLVGMERAVQEMLSAMKAYP